MGALARGLVLCLGVSGCGTSATVRFTGGGEISGQVVERRSRYLVVQEKGGRRLAIPAQEVADVSHPGNPAMVIGGGLVMASAPFVVLTAAADCGSDIGGAICARYQRAAMVLPVTVLTIGMGMTLWGISTYTDSVSRSGHAAHAEAEPLPPSPQQEEWSPPF